MLFHVYSEPKPDGYYINEPFGIYRTILDADWLLWILLPILLIILVAGLMIAWRIHEIPSHRATHNQMRQAQLVSALTVLGLFVHWVWAVALFLAYVDWDAVEDWLVRVLRRARMSEGDEIPKEAGNALSAATAPPMFIEPTIQDTPALTGDKEHTK